MTQHAAVTKPASGHWTDAYPELGRGPVSLEDCVSEEFYEKEREHVFKKTWLYVGRVERVPQSGSYFTRELRVPQHVDHHRAGQGRRDPRPPQRLPAPRQQDAVGGRPVPGGVRAGRRCCTAASTAGATTWTARCTRPTRKDLLLDFDADSCRVPAIQCEVWEGFIFINLDPHNTESVRDYLGELAHGIEGYPFEGPHQVYKFKAELQCNWKIFVDGFAESYHGPYLHASSFGSVTAEARDAFDKPNPFTDALAYQLKGPHRMYSFSGEPSQKTPYSKPIECVMEASAAGPWNKRADRGPMPPGLNPMRSEKYGFDSYQFFPNFVLIFGASGFTVHTHWPTGPHATSSRRRCTTSRQRPTRSGWAKS